MAGDARRILAEKPKSPYRSGFESAELLLFPVGDEQPGFRSVSLDSQGIIFPRLQTRGLGLQNRFQEVAFQIAAVNAVTIGDEKV